MADEDQDGNSAMQTELDQSSLPKDAQVITSILKDMGVTEYEPRVINQLLEFVYRYVTDVLDDAKLYSSHAGNSSISREDVKFAIQMKLDHSFTNPPPRDFLVDLARQKNSTALPTLKTYTGARLPPDRYCLTSSNYRLKSQSKSLRKMSRQGSSSVGYGHQQPTYKPTVNAQMATPGKRKWQDVDDYDI
ncbi:transcription initiation factor TFIID subunit 9-like [Styela clava]